jgi:hypothetical protein
LKKKGVIFHKFEDRELAIWEKANPDFFTDLVERLARKSQGKDARYEVDLWEKMRGHINCH